MIDLDKRVGALVCDKERGSDIKPAEDALFRELVASGLTVDAAYVAQRMAMKAALARHSALPHSLAHLVALAGAMDAAADALIERMDDFAQTVDGVRSTAAIDMDVSLLEGWREVFIARLQNGFGVRLADLVPSYAEMRDGQ